MKKYLILGMALVALVAVLVSFSWKEESTAADGCCIAFWGAVKEDVTVSACKDGGGPCFYGVGDSDDRYEIRIPNQPQYWGAYTLSNGCQTYHSFYFGVGHEVNFCVPDPPLFYCKCF